MELDSAQYHTARNLTQRSIILRRTAQKNTNISAKNETKTKTVLTHQSVAQAGSNDEKNWGRKSRWTVPLNPNAQNFENYIFS